MLLSAQSLASEEVFAIEDGVGTTIRIDSGEVRVTEDGSFIDHILCGGQEYTIDRPGRAIVAAQMESRFSLYTGKFS